MGTRTRTAKTWATVLGVCGVCILGLGLIGNAVRLTNRLDRLSDAERSAASATSPLVPYTAVLRAVRYSPDSSSQARWEETHAVRSDGAYMRLDRVLENGGPLVRRDIYLPSGVRMTLNDVSELKTTYQGVYRRPYRSPDSQCKGIAAGLLEDRAEEILGEGIVNGHRVLNIRTQLSTTSFAPDLSCAILHAVGHSGPLGYLVKELVSLTPGEPDPSLFAVPNRYREAPPSARVGIPSDSVTAQSLDRGYGQRDSRE
jgi:hypothetical protein